MKTLEEYLATSNDITVNEAKNNLNELMSARIHDNCSSDEGACKLCLLEQLLKDYRTYFESRNEIN